MPTQQQILESVKSHPEGISLGQLAEEYSVKPFQLTAALAGLRKKDLIERSGDLYKVKTNGGEGGDKPTPRALPSDYDEFTKIMKSCGIDGDFQKAIADYIFQGDPYDIGAVYERLKSLHLRPDTTSRLTSMWASSIGKALPPKIAEATVPNTPATQPEREKKFSVVGSSIIADPEGDLTHSQALKELELKLQHQNQPQPQNQQQNQLLEHLVSQNNALMAQLLDARFDALGRQIQGIAQGQQELNKYGLLNNWGQGVLGELRGIRGDVKPILETAVKIKQPPPPPRTPEDRARLAKLGKQAVEAERRAQAIEDKFLGLSSASSAPKPAPPPTVIIQ